jgi:hypothetical protein
MPLFGDGCFGGKIKKTLFLTLTGLLSPQIGVLPQLDTAPLELLPASPRGDSLCVRFFTLLFEGWRFQP